MSPLGLPWPHRSQPTLLPAGVACATRSANPGTVFVPAHPSTESSFNSIHRARRTGKSTPGRRAELPSADPFEIVLVEGDESVRIEGDVGLEAAGAVAHHPGVQRPVPPSGGVWGDVR